MRSFLSIAATLVAGCGGFRPVADGAVDGGAGDADVSGFHVADDSPDGGATLRGVWGSAPDDVYAVGDRGRILHWDGAQWFRAGVGTGHDLSGVWGAARDDVWAVGSTPGTGRGILFHRTKDIWIEIGATTFGLKSVWGAGSQRWAVGVEGAIYWGTKTAPFASGMQVEPNLAIPPSPLDPILWSVGGNSALGVMVAADVDTTLFFDGTWHFFSDPNDRTRTFRAIWGPPLAEGAAPDIYQGANYFGIWHFTGSQNPVVQLNEEKDAPHKVARFVWGIWGPSPDRVVFVGDEGRIMTYDAMRQEVRVRPSPTTRSLYGVWGSSLDDVWIVGEGGLVLRGRVDF